MKKMLVIIIITTTVFFDKVNEIDFKKPILYYRHFKVYTMKTKYANMKTLYVIKLQLEKQKEVQEIIDLPSFKITFYDLGIESCGKSRSNPGYGRTATGLSLVGRSIQNIRIISVDPRVVPLHSKVKLIFKKQFNFLSGVYLAEDIGGAIKGNHFDLYLGESASREASDYGVQYAKVKIIS